MKFSRFFGRVRQQGHLILFGHILNAPWKSREARRKQRYTATRGAALRYLERYADDLRNAVPEKIDMTPESERAFTIWFQGEENAPDLVKSCFRSMRRHLKQELVVLDVNSLFDWISLPEYIVDKWRKGKIPHAHFSDICRVELLYKHGGVWLDATDYVTVPIPDFIIDEDFFVFTSGNKIRGSYSGIQNCFIRGKKGNPLLGIWREAMFMYWKDENSYINYFVHHLLLYTAVVNNIIASSNFEKMPKVIQDPTHRLWSDHYKDKFDKDVFENLTKDSFFQKTSYKSPGISELAPDSMGAYMINL